MKKLTTMICMAATALGIAAQRVEAQSVPSTRVYFDFTGNDCSGVFGRPLSNCAIKDSNDTTLANILLKGDTSSGRWEVNTDVFPGTVYTDVVPFPNLSTFPVGGMVIDPSLFGSDGIDVKYWAAKAGNGFRLHWRVPNSEVGACVPGEFNAYSGYRVTNFNDACLRAALGVLSNQTNYINYGTPERKSLSHLSFYGTKTNRTTNNVVNDIVRTNESSSLYSLVVAGLIGGGVTIRRLIKK